MGPLYHLPEEIDRICAVEAALKLLKPGGLLFVAFINVYAAVWDGMVRAPEGILQFGHSELVNCFVNATDFSGKAFGPNYFIRPGHIDPFMACFPLRKLHLVGSESILSLREKELAAQPPEVFTSWLDFAEKVCEREEFLSMASHFLYIGEKI
jgi:hypothetical protein